MTKYEYVVIEEHSNVYLGIKINEFAKDGFRVISALNGAVILERPTVESNPPIQHDPKKEFMTQFLSAGIDCELQEDGSVIIKLENSNYQTDIKFHFNNNGILNKVEHRSRIIPK